jgi:hypothetical protein
MIVRAGEPKAALGDYEIPLAGNVLKYKLPGVCIAIF